MIAESFSYFSMLLEYRHLLLLLFYLEIITSKSCYWIGDFVFPRDLLRDESEKSYLRAKEIRIDEKFFFNTVLNFRIQWYQKHLFISKVECDGGFWCVDKQTKFIFKKKCIKIQELKLLLFVCTQYFTKLCVLGKKKNQKFVVILIIIYVLHVFCWTRATV